MHVLVTLCHLHVNEVCQSQLVILDVLALFQFINRMTIYKLTNVVFGACNTYTYTPLLFCPC